MSKILSLIAALFIAVTIALTLNGCSSIEQNVRLNRKEALRSIKKIAIVPSKLTPSLSQSIFDLLENSNKVIVLTYAQFDSVLARAGIGIADILEDRHVLTDKVVGVDAIVLVGQYSGLGISIQVVDAHTGKQMLDEDIYISKGPSTFQEVLERVKWDILGQGGDRQESY